MKWRAGEYNVELDGEKLYIGDSPKLIINLKTQKNFIRYEEENIPYKKEIRISPGSATKKTPRGISNSSKILLSAGMRNCRRNPNCQRVRKEG